MKDAGQKTETLNLRVSPELKTALRVAAGHERRSMANMIEFLILSYCRNNNLVVVSDCNTYENEQAMTDEK